MDLLFLLFSFWLDLFRTREDLMFEMAALRHQLIVYKRREKKKLIINDNDRVLWCFLSKLWVRWKDVLCFVKPETVIGWHRRTFKAYWTWKSRPTGKPGRPKTPEDIRKLVIEIASANPSWGAPRIHGELKKLGVKIS